MQITFTVTQEDINEGRPCSHRFCPVALALKRATPLFDWLSLVSDGTIWLGDNLIARHTPELRSWIKSFDTDQPVKPATFTLDFSKQNSL